MSKSEVEKKTREFTRGLELAEYRMLREKAMRNQIVINSDGNGGLREIPARELFVKLYNEPVPQF